MSSRRASSSSGLLEIGARITPRTRSCWYSSSAGALAGRVVRAVGQQHRETGRRGDFPDTARQIAEERVGDIHHDEPDRGAAPGPQLSGRLVAHPSQLVDRLHDPASGLRGDQFGLVQHVRDGPDGYLGQRRDVLHADRWPLAHASSDPFARHGSCPELKRSIARRRRVGDKVLDRARCDRACLPRGSDGEPSWSRKEHARRPSTLRTFQSPLRPVSRGTKVLVRVARRSSARRSHRSPVSTPCVRACTRRFPNAVASTGPATTGRPAASATS